jgi:hypothetical protein
MPKKGSIGTKSMRGGGMVLLIISDGAQELPGVSRTSPGQAEGSPGCCGLSRKPNEQKERHEWRVCLKKEGTWLAWYSLERK